jgi:hypothetical protein
MFKFFVTINGNKNAAAVAGGRELGRMPTKGGVRGRRRSLDYNKHVTER